MNKPSKVTDLDWKLLTEKYKNKKLEKVVKLIEKDYPIQYLIGNVDFYGYEIFVKKGVLIPRFETEGLLEETIKLLKDENMDDISVLDIGTGTGCIPVVLKKELPNLEITSIDVNRKAIKLAKLNASNYNVKINFIKKNVFHYKPINKYSLIISNPPYVLPSLYAMAEVFVYPSIYEGFGIPIIEAIRCGLPVVACSGSCLEEAGGPDNIYVAPGDVLGMSNAIRRSLVGSAHRETRIQRSQGYVQRFAGNDVAGQVYQLYHQILSRS